VTSITNYRMGVARPTRISPDAYRPASNACVATAHGIPRKPISTTSYGRANDEALPGYLQCVPYARQASGIQLFGDARTWWDQAAGRYSRGHAPGQAR
jgi:hypothetical protein